jgi:H+/Cl- antiporter ClcA
MAPTYFSQTFSRDHNVVPMPEYKQSYITEQSSIIRFLLKWTIWSIPLSIFIGSAIALFLWLLDLVTNLRFTHHWLLFTLPLTGLVTYLLYKLWGKNAEKGNDLIMDEIHQPGAGVPGRMAPLILVVTILTHLSGGSAGREGTAVQMGGSLAASLAKWTKINETDRRLLLMMGISGGFSAVFGTPMAGTIFAMEVLSIGIMRYSALLPCFIAALLSNTVTVAWGIHHEHYIISSVVPTDIAPYLHVNVPMVALAVLGGIAFGLASRSFARLSHTIKHVTTANIKPLWIIPLLGSAVVIMGTYALGTTDYLGLGAVGETRNSVSIVSAFHPHGATYFSWMWKLLFTAVTLSCGFKGGEVTPLFFIGATLGNAVAALTGAPTDLFAAMGFVAVFAGATNTPLACTIMAVELFGGTHVLYYAVACFTAYYFSGHAGIYSAQRVEISKHGD